MKYLLKLEADLDEQFWSAGLFMFMTYRKQIMNFRGPGYTRFHKVSGPH